MKGKNKMKTKTYLRYISCVLAVLLCVASIMPIAFADSTNHGNSESLLTGSNYSDTLIGNTLNNSFAAGYGNDLIIGGGGYDVVTYSGIKSTDAEI